MSDRPQGDDWWLASDDKWYPPQSWLAPPPPPVEETGYKVTGRRIVAALIDLVPLAVLFIGMAASFGELETTSGSLSNAPFLVFLVAFVAYFVVMEGVAATTLGKWIMGLEVSRLGGAPLTWGAVLGRNALRLVDFLPFFYLVGIIAVWVTPTRQRLGDLATKTQVVRRRKEPSMPPVPQAPTKALSEEDSTVEPALTDHAPQPPGDGRFGYRVGTVFGVAVLTLAVGGVFWASGSNGNGEAVDELNLAEMRVFVDETMETVYRPMSRDALMERSAPELVALPGFPASVNNFFDILGPLVDYTILDVTTALIVIDESEGPVPGAEYTIRADFEKGSTTLTLTVVNRGGVLQITGWNLCEIQRRGAG